MGASGRRSKGSRPRSGAAARRLAQPGEAGREGRRGSARADERGARADQGARAGSRAAAGRRDPAQGVGVFCPGGARPPVEAMIAFIDDHRASYGALPIRRVLPIAPQAYHAHVARRRDPARASARARRDAELRSEIARVHAETFGLSRRSEGLAAARARGRRGGPLHGGAADADHGPAGRCARQAGAHHHPRQGAAVPAGPREPAVPRARAGSALGQRLRPAPRPGRASPTQPSSSTPTRAASRARRVSRSATAGFVAGALEQAIHQRRPEKGAGLVAHSGRGSSVPGCSAAIRMRAARRSG